MITYTESSIGQLIIHKTGNKLLDEGLFLSEQALDLTDPVLGQLLLQYFVSSFEKPGESYQFSHSSGDLGLNEVYHFCKSFFENGGNFVENSQQIAKHLFDISNHPKIKSGELYICDFQNLQLDGEMYNAVGIFKSESKEPYITVQQHSKYLELGYETAAINIKKLDKGCLIFNTGAEDGYQVFVIDQTNRSSEAVYWVDEFLKLKVRNDNFNQTKNVLQVYKEFVTKQMDEEFDLSRADKIDLLNRSIKYFKDNDQFELDDFANEVIANPQGIESFKNYKQQYESDYEMPIEDSFSINDIAVKKQARVFKSVLKLDKNFHIYIHGNKEMIERGFDDDKNLHYYKVYFREEQ